MRTATRGSILAIALILATLAAACTDDGTTDTTSRPGPEAAEPSGEPVRGGTLRVGLSAEPRSLDVTVHPTSSTAVATYPIFETLFARDADLVPQPFLVEDWTEDGLVYTFQLRPDIVFHDGSALDAEDVVASLERFFSIAGGAVGMVDAVDELVATGPLEVRLTTTRPAPVIDALTANQAVILPAEVLATAGPEPLRAEQLVGTGPFRFVEWQPNVTLVLERFADYQPLDAEASGLAGTRAAYVDRIEFSFVPDPNGRLAGLQTGQFDFVEQLPPDSLGTLQRDTEVQVYLARQGFFVLQLNAQEPPFDDPEVRAAVLRGLDIDDIASAIGPPDVYDANPFIPVDGIRLHSEAGTDAWNAKDIEGARKALADLGVQGAQVQLVSVAAANTLANIGAVAEEQLGALGFDVSVLELDTTAMQTLRSQAEGWNVIPSIYAEFNDPNLLMFIRCGNPYGGYCDEELEGLLDEYSAAEDDAARQDVYDKVHASLYETVPAVKIADNYSVSAASTSVKGYVGDTFTPYFWNVWLQP